MEGWKLGRREDLFHPSKLPTAVKRFHALPSFPRDHQ